ncbi:MAG TPA: bifunctional diguanylate cyclase/phosphodiesterase [Treponemataceae bacterium]|nr:bifunctional diguanylate cyclase/phosphodiesterase [Treponemataceae bacterium]
MEDYNKLIQKRVDKSINIILGISSALAFIATFILFTANIPKAYAILNFGTGLIALLFSLFANKIETSYKIMLMIFLTSFIAVASFIGGSFYSAFNIVLLLSNVLAVLFLRRRKNIIISIYCISILFVLCYYSVFIKENTDIVDPLLTWGTQIIAYVLLIMVLQISIFAIKKFLMENIGHLNKAIERSNQLAYYDQLTQLPNALKFKIDVAEKIKTNRKNGFIVFINLKSLNLINSTLGNQVGDQALVEVATLFKRIRMVDSVVARTGGNEFAVWIDDITEENLCIRFDSVLHELNEQCINLKKKLEFYASYASFKYNEQTLDECYQHATLTLTYAKDNNILKLVAYNDTLEKNLRRKEKIKDLIGNALEKEEFTLFYQEKVDSRTNIVIGVEGLARWYNKELGFILPYEFIPIIESLNMSIDFGNFVINRACRDYEKLQKKYHNDVAVSINISPSHLIHASIINVVKEALSKHNVPGNKFTIEITEEIIIQNIEVVKLQLAELKNLNVKISLDDFGTGYSSLNYLTQLEIGEIKIDKSFIDQIGANPNINLLLELIIHLSKELNLEIIAEGVETIEQRDILSLLGCHVIQGYFYSKPEAIE